MEQISEAVEQVQTGGKRLKPRGKAPFVIAAAVLAILLVVYLGLCAYANAQQVFYPKRNINGVPVGGLTVAQAQEKLETELLAQPIEITDDTLQTRLTITVADLGYTPAHFEGDAQFWMDTTQTGVSFLRKGWVYIAYITGRYPGGANWPDMDAAVLNDTVKRVTDFFSEAPIDGSYTILQDDVRVTRARDGRAVSEVAVKQALADIASYSKTDYRMQISCEIVPARELTAQQVYHEIAGELKNAGYDAATDSITEEQVGVEFDVSAAQKKLDETEPGKTVLIGASVQTPSVTAEELKEVLFRDVLGECRTHVSGTVARINNVKLSASSINGYVMNTGDVFSYNGVVGQRTAENGYQAAPAYVKGETVDEIGGSICQTSSTLYLACLRGNLEITERYAHRYVPAYIPWGMDATVSWGGPDYLFTNNTDYPIKIVTEYANNYLTVKILGTNIDGSYAKVTNEVLSTAPWETVYQEDPVQAPGTTSVKTTAYTGYKVRTYHTIYDKDGKIIDSHFEADSNYKVRNKVILVAPGELPHSAPNVPAVAAGTVTETVPETPMEPTQPESPADTTEPSVEPQTPTESVEDEAAMP